MAYVLDGQWVSAAGPLIVKTIESDDGNGNIVYGSDLTYFDTPGLSHAEGAGQVTPQVIVSPYINGPEYPAYKFALQPVAVEDGRYRSVDPTGLQVTTYRLTFRTSNLSPNLAAKASTCSRAKIEGDYIAPLLRCR